MFTSYNIILIILIKYINPYKEKKNTRINIITEALLSIIHISMIIFENINKEDKKWPGEGYLIIYLISIILVIHTSALI